MKRAAKPDESSMQFVRVNPNPRLVRLVDYAIDEVVSRLNSDNDAYADWLKWAASWRAGERQPAACVDIAHRCFADEERLIKPSLGQLAWGAKEACYTNPKSGWLVIRYIADAMLVFNVAFPDKPLLALESKAHNKLAFSKD